MEEEGDWNRRELGIMGEKYGGRGDGGVMTVLEGKGRVWKINGRGKEGD